MEQSIRANESFKPAFKFELRGSLAAAAVITAFRSDFTNLCFLLEELLQLPAGPQNLRANTQTQHTYYDNRIRQLLPLSRSVMHVHSQAASCKRSTNRAAKPSAYTSNKAFIEGPQPRIG